MTDEPNKAYETAMVEYLKARVSRAAMLKGAAAGVALSLVPAAALANVTAPGTTTGGTTTSGVGGAPANSTSFPFFPQVTGTYTTEDIGSIANIAVTAEHLAVTVLTAAVNSKALNLASNSLLLAIIQAALIEELYHLQFLRDGLGAKPLTTTFTVPDPKILTDPVTFLNTIEVAENIFVGAYMTATREFAELGQPLLAKYAYQIGAVEAEHRTLARAGLALLGDKGSVPPNNKAFETDLFLYVKDAAALLVSLGFIGGSGTAASYPGDAAAVTAAGAIGQSVIQKTPNNATTSVTTPSAAAIEGARS